MANRMSLNMHTATRIWRWQARNYRRRGYVIEELTPYSGGVRVRLRHEGICRTITAPLCVMALDHDPEAIWTALWRSVGRE
jgi:hypothetical protein